MEDSNMFMDKSAMPDDAALRSALGDTHRLWCALRDDTFASVPRAAEEWKYPGAAHGWSYRIKDGKRNLLYFLPRDGFFKIAMVFGERACEAVYSSDVSDSIKQALREARPYVEGRGIRIDVRTDADLGDIRTLLGIKLQP